MALTALAALCACGPASPPALPDAPLRVGVLPEHDPDVLAAIYAPLFAHLEEQTGLELELSVPRGYGQAIQDFAAGRVDLAWFGGLTFVRAEQRCATVPLVMRDIDLTSTTDLLVSGADDATSVADLAGRRFSFGPRLSTSGHLMPRAFLAAQGIEPGSFFAEVHHSAGHHQTALWIQDGTVDAGAANSLTIEEMFRDGRLAPDRVRVLERTPTYHNYVWCVRGDLDPRLVDLLRDAFLALDPSRPAHAAILDGLSARGFVPASATDLDHVREAAAAHFRDTSAPY